MQQTSYSINKPLLPSVFPSDGPKPIVSTHHLKVLSQKQAYPEHCTSFPRNKCFMQFGARTLEEWARSLRPAEATLAEERLDAPSSNPNEIAEGSQSAFANISLHEDQPSENVSNYARNSGQGMLDLTTSAHNASKTALSDGKPTHSAETPAQQSTKPTHSASLTITPTRSNNSSLAQSASNAAAHPSGTNGTAGAVSAVNGASSTVAPQKPLSWAERVARNTPGHAPESNIKKTTNKTTLSRAQPKVPAPPLPPLPPRRLRGLINAGNSCFISVCLQSLIACDPFRRYLLSLRGNHSNPPLVSKFVELAVQMSVLNGQEESISSSNLQTRNSKSQQGSSKHIPNLSDPILPDWSHNIFEGSTPSSTSDQSNANGGRRSSSQEDAEEFLMFILNKLHDELIAAGKNNQENFPSGILSGKEIASAAQRLGQVNSHTYASSMNKENGGGEWQEINRRGRPVQVRESHTSHSPITKLFGGQLRHELKKAHSQTSANKEPFLSLQLGIESGMIRDVKDALIEVFRVEHLESDLESKYQSNMRKQILLDSLPQVLILHIKRFTSNPHTQAVSKVVRRLEFPEHLTIPSSIFYSPMLPKPNEREYRLSAVVTHIGKEMADGHYVVDIRVPDGDKDSWVTCDDHRIVQSNLQGVLRRQAYLLFYTRVLDGT